jgi:ABC-type oligopeptide transport system ATPase subunit
VQAQILNLLADLRDRRGLSMIFIAHDLAVIGFIADRVAVMHRGRIVEQGPTEAVLRAPQSAHGRALLAALPRPRLAGSAASAAAEPPMPQSE